MRFRRERLDRLERRLPAPAPAPPELVTSFADLTLKEQIELDDLLAIQERHEHLWRPGRRLTKEERQRMETLLSRGVLVPRGSRIEPAQT